MTRRWTMTVLSAFLAVVPLAVGCHSTGAHASLASVREGVFIHLTKGPEDPHAVAMALKMANLMAADRDALVYCDLKGINTVLKDAPDISFTSFDPSRKQISDLLEKGVTVYACPGCLKALGKAPTDLMPGVRVAEKDAFFSFTKGRILTLDY
jgi:predicted peroxiredoxin